MESPCRNCKPPERYPGCQDHCEKGIAYKTMANKRKEIITKNKRRDVEIIDYTINKL